MAGSSRGGADGRRGAAHESVNAGVVVVTTVMSICSLLLEPEEYQRLTINELQKTASEPRHQSAEFAESVTQESKAASVKQPQRS